jgi:hypothetical protein
MVIRTVQHAGMLHFVIDSPDGTRGLLPEWMTASSAAELPLVKAPTLSLAALRALRATIDGLPLSSAVKLNSAQEIDGHVDATPGSAARLATPCRTISRPRKAPARSSRGGWSPIEEAFGRVRPASDDGELDR